LLEGESQAVRSVLLTNSANGGGGCREPDAPPNHRGRTERLAAAGQAERLALDEHAIFSVTDRQG
jgi:hypothetical protein